MSDEKIYVDDANRFTVKHEYSDSWIVNVVSEELRDAIVGDIERHKDSLELRHGPLIPSDEFDKCMKKNGFEPFKEKDYHMQTWYKGYIIFNGDEDKENYIKIAFRDFYSVDEEHIYTISPYYNGDEEYVNDIMEMYWQTICGDIYKAIISFLNDEDCSGERAIKEAKEKERKLIREKEEALDAEFKVKAEVERKLLEEREKKLINLRMRRGDKKIARLLEENGKNDKPINNTNYYKSNNEYVSPELNNVKLLSRFYYEIPVDHQFIVAVKNKKYENAIDADELISYSNLNDIIVLPVWNLSSKHFLCHGLSHSYAKESILKSDITIALVEPRAETDDTYFAGVATLIVKDDTVEIDVICSQIGYKMAGRMLMNKIFDIARKLGKSKLELKSVANSNTIKFYKSLLFKKVEPENNFAKEAKRKQLIAFRRRITRKNSNKDAAGGAGVKLSNKSNNKSNRSTSKAKSK